eukprot:SAG11_NODE_30353_length_301_cov_5.222772_1_plen_50_part_10
MSADLQRWIDVKPGPPRNEPYWRREAPRVTAVRAVRRYPSVLPVVYRFLG